MSDAVNTASTPTLLVSGEDKSFRVVARAIDDVRRGWPVVITEAGQSITVQPAETVIPSFLRGEEVMLLTAERAKHIGLDPESAPLVAVELDSVPSQIIPSLLFSSTTNQQSPITNSLPSLSTLHLAAMALVKEAGWLPAAVITPTEAQRSAVSATDILNIIHAPVQLTELTTEAARVPLKYAENAKLRMFREQLSSTIHLAIIIGEPKGAPLVRVHSSCFTGDLLGSLRCDCGEQLHFALEDIAAGGGGVLLYLHQEGRDIGLAHKLKAYQLQDAGVDTVDANEMLGFKPDERDFTVAAQLLKRLGMTTIRLMTNNPAKAEALEAAGIRVNERVPLVVESNPHNASYLATKMAKLRHKLPIL